jgi:hypothetical protein
MEEPATVSNLTREDGLMRKSIPLVIIAYGIMKQLCFVKF